MRRSIFLAVLGRGKRSRRIHARIVRGFSLSTITASLTPTARIHAGKSIPAVYPRFVGVRQLLRDDDAHESGAIHKNQRLTIARMDYKKEIGRRIKAARNEKGWSLVELSRRTNDLLSDTRIGNYETGERRPGPAEVTILAKALGKRPAYFMAVDDAQLPISPQEEKLVENWRKLPENQRMSVFRQVEQLAMTHRDAIADARVEQAKPKAHKPVPQKVRS